MVLDVVLNNGDLLRFIKTLDEAGEDLFYLPPESTLGRGHDTIRFGGGAHDGTGTRILILCEAVDCVEVFTAIGFAALDLEHAGHLEILVSRVV